MLLAPLASGVKWSGRVINAKKGGEMGPQAMMDRTEAGNSSEGV